VGVGVGRLNDGGAYITISAIISLSQQPQSGLTLSTLPLSALSVVAATFPPFLLRSQAISRRLSCGNMLATWSICAGFMRARAVCVCVGLMLEGLLKYQRTARKVTTRKTRTWGMLIDWEGIVAYVGVA